MLVCVGAIIHELKYPKTLKNKMAWQCVICNSSVHGIVMGDERIDDATGHCWCDACIFKELFVGHMYWELWNSPVIASRIFQYLYSGHTLASSDEQPPLASAVLPALN